MRVFKLIKKYKGSPSIGTHIYQSKRNDSYYETKGFPKVQMLNLNAIIDKSDCWLEVTDLKDDNIDEEYSYVTFNQSKLLLEKCNLKRQDLGFSYSSVGRPYYNESGELNGDCINHVKKLINDQPSILYPAPEHHQVVEFFRKKYGIWIQTPFSYSDNKTYVWTISKIDDESDKNCWLSGIDTDIVGWNTPQKAMSNAIDYVLNTLILINN